MIFRRFNGHVRGYKVPKYMCNTIRQEPKDAGVFISLTKVAEENNAESLLIIHDKRLVSLYTMNWQEHALHSEVYAGRGFNRVPIIT